MERLWNDKQGTDLIQPTQISDSYVWYKSLLLINVWPLYACWNLSTENITCSNHFVMKCNDKLNDMYWFKVGQTLSSDGTVQAGSLKFHLLLLAAEHGMQLTLRNNRLWTWKEVKTSAQVEKIEPRSDLRTDLPESCWMQANMSLTLGKEGKWLQSEMIMLFS